MKALLSVLAFGLASTLACETENATTAIVDNHDTAVVYRAWWVATYFDAPVAVGASSSSLRSVPATGPAYALLAPGWDPASGTPPVSFAIRQSRAVLSVERGAELHITVADDAFLGACAAPLSDDDRAFVAERIFPGELAGLTYDVATCLFQPASNDASAPDAATDGG